MSMTPKLRGHFEAELRQGNDAERAGDLARAWRHLERAHVLSQAHAGPHVRVHVRMFAFGWRRRDLRELVGQWVRILVAAPGSWFGRAPLGNTGGANVGILTPLPIPEDLRAMLEA
ncbi:hypothetical protein DRW03_12495 [Corallococcus sp. H22C18031201]|uniref:DUF3703 domain-containing protein n=1 Tax=Citreicoccus inhibens TaxID=2849499 RepID=UPI000E759849|nr:DUF3703 domain-containing protein [Citreicoccus inhibens]MBU8894159.1 DUF3703 domain-containing protein [Citreicoccus inhibens]RJS23137.1 hypothetical protein DRW03_12495 [Corallococcus sp. H22C18031201]